MQPPSGAGAINLRALHRRAVRRALEFFSAQCDAVLSSDLEALAAEVLRELEDETAAMLSGRGNGGGGPGSGPENKTSRT